MKFFEEVYKVVKLIPKGKVTTYGEIAKLIGVPRGSRAVGYALHNNPLPGIIPCHRVVNRQGQLSGSFAFGGADAQAKLLQSEGVKVVNNCVDLKKYGVFYQK